MKEIEVDLPEDTLQSLGEMAQKEGITLDELCARILREGLREDTVN